MLRDKLLKLRSDVAKENHGATYLVFNDKELDELLQKKPQTLDELGKIKGFPKNGKRVACYGQRLVNIFSSKKTGESSLSSSDIQRSSFF